MAYNGFYKDIVYVPNMNIAFHISDDTANTFKLYSDEKVPGWFKKLNFDQQESIPRKVAEEFLAHCPDRYTPAYAWERNTNTYIYTGCYDINEKISDIKKFLEPYKEVGMCGGFGMADDECVVRSFEYYPKFIRVENGSIPHGRADFFDILYKSGEIEKMTGKPLNWSMKKV